MDKPNSKVTAVEAARLVHAVPFREFVILCLDGRRIEASFAWQALVGAAELFVAEASAASITRIASKVHVIAYSEIADLEVLEPTIGGVVDRKKTAKPASATKGVVEVALFTDGACKGNPGPGGWGFILRDSRLPTELKEAGGDRATTNNRMELTSVIEGLERVEAPARVTLTTDSQYVTKGITDWMAGWKRRGWKRMANGRLEPVANLDLWQRLDVQCQRLEVVCQWVRGHVGHPENEECDRMAVAAYQNL